MSNTAGGDNTTTNDIKKKYDIILFGCTGFTGQLAVKDLLRKQNKDSTAGGEFHWAVSARNVQKAEGILQTLVQEVSQEGSEFAGTLSMPDILQVDLVCPTKEEESKLLSIVQQTKVVLTCSGPFEKYGKTLCRFCCQNGVHYSDITGETDFVREMVSLYDTDAKTNHAIVIPHCGNDCIPQDLTVYEINRYVQETINKDNTAKYIIDSVQTYVDFPEATKLSGGTAATATYQLSKDRGSSSQKPDYDPLLNVNGSKSEYNLQNISPKTDVPIQVKAYTDETKNAKATAGPWLMGPVMVNCIRRSNALLQYNKSLKYGDSQIRNHSITNLVSEFSQKVLIGGAIYLPFMGFQSLLPQPGEGPTMETMEQGFLNCYGKAKLIIDSEDAATNEKDVKWVESKFHFAKDISYLYTAKLLVEVGMLLLKKTKEDTTKIQGGLTTPAAAFGHELTEHILKEMDASFEIQLLDYDKE